METPAAGRPGPSLPRLAARARTFFGRWAWADVVLPAVLVRLLLLTVGWVSQDIAANPKYPVPEAAERAWHYTHYVPLDMWARWDSGWYFGIVRDGYAPAAGGGLHTEFAFFPLYPYVVKLLALPFPERMQTTQRLLILGLLASQAFTLGALLLLHRLVASWGDRETARRAVLYVLLFPTGFFLFCFYTESAFLFLSLAAFYAASRGRWWLAGLAGALLALTRPPGVLIAAPLLWLYLGSVGWRPARVRPNVLWLLLVPAGLLAYLYYAYTQTGDFLAPVHAQAAWGKSFAMPWTTILSPKYGSRFVTTVEQVLSVAFLALSVFCLFRLPSAAYGIYALMLVLPPLTTGTLLSTSRYYVVVFPAFVGLALLGRHAALDRLLVLTLFALQAAFMVMWARLYWVA